MNARLSEGTKPLVIVIGYGNLLRGDDAFGPRVAERIGEEFDVSLVRVLARHSLVPELAAALADVGLAVFVDAAANGVPGQLVCRPIPIAAGHPEAIPHVLEPGRLVSLAWELYGRTPPSFIVCVTGQSFEWSVGQLSPLVEAAVQPAVDQVRLLVERELNARREPPFRYRQRSHRARKEGRLLWSAGFP